MLSRLPTQTKAGEGLGATATVPHSPAVNLLNDVMPFAVNVVAVGAVGEVEGYVQVGVSNLAGLRLENTAPPTKSPAM